MSESITRRAGGRVALFGLALLVGRAAVGPLLIMLREPDDGRTLPAGVPGRMIDVDGNQVHVVEKGAGPALLLVHGFGASTQDLEQFELESLAQTHRVIAVDRHNFRWRRRREDSLAAGRGGRISRLERPTPLASITLRSSVIRWAVASRSCSLPVTPSASSA